MRRAGSSGAVGSPVCTPPLFGIPWTGRYYRTLKIHIEWTIGGGMPIYGIPLFRTIYGAVGSPGCTPPWFGIPWTERYYRTLKIHIEWTIGGGMPIYGIPLFRTIYGAVGSPGCTPPWFGIPWTERYYRTLKIHWTIRYDHIWSGIHLAPYMEWWGAPSSWMARYSLLTTRWVCTKLWKMGLWLNIYLAH